jgi:ABC-2 type transport system ATP-binding protein
MITTPLWGKTMQKTIRCPKCHTLTTCTGEPGETIKVTCPSCNTVGKITIQEVDTQSSQRSLVSVQNISKRYKDVLALDNVTFTINKGDIFGYIGPNGAGKTTTIKIMVGLLNKTSGHLSINGFSMPEQKTFAHKFIGYMPQNVAFQQWRSANHALSTFGRLSGIDKSKLQSRIDETLDLLGLTTYKNKRVSKLSGGTIQKLGIAQALLHNPDLLILDEPLNGLDPDSRYQVKHILKQLSTNGTTVFFSSHILSDVQDVATKICILDWGHVVTIGSLEELKSEFIKEKQIEIQFSKRSETFHEIQKIPGVKEIIEQSKEKIVVTLEKTTDTDAITNMLITTLLKNNCHIRSITPTHPSLDEIYQFYLRKGGKQP